MRIIFLPEVLDYFNELSTILYEKDYFGFEKYALDYVDDLLKDIENNLDKNIQRFAPSYFDKYGAKMFYTTFKKNKNTHWYVFFSKYKKENEIIYLVRHISNNHIIAQYL